jgi:hypothetical protein
VKISENYLMNSPFLAALTVLLLSSCSGIGKSCRNTDWYQVGAEDYNRARPLSYWSIHQDRCAQEKRLIDREAYEFGWKDAKRKAPEGQPDLGSGAQTPDEIPEALKH